MPFNDFVQTELPKRPFTNADGAAGQIPVRSTNPLAARELEFADLTDVLDGLPDADSTTPTSIAVRQGGTWRRIGWAAFLTLVGATGGSLDPDQVTVNGAGVTIGGVAVVIAGSATEMTINGEALEINGQQVTIS